jgi:Flp pilus assembly protein TadG
MQRKFPNKVTRARRDARSNSQERGFVLITMAAGAIALVAALGLAVDVGRMFIAKNETQAFCDSAALAAALSLDGTTTGILAAQAAVANSTNAWNLNTTKIASPTVTFATAVGGPWDPNPSPATGYIYVKVAATAQLSLYFMPVIVSQTTQNVNSLAIAGQITITSFPQGLAPYTAVSTNTTGPNFGLVVGNSYDIQWPKYNGSSFLSPPCAGDLANPATIAAVTANWGSSNSGYWGATSNNVIEHEIVDLNAQTTPVAVGDNIFPVLTNGQKQSQAGYLDERVNQDVNKTDNIVGAPGISSTYFGDVHNARRLLPIPIVDPLDVTHTKVIGFGQFLLLSNGKSDYYEKTTGGNDPFCAIYAGPYCIGCINPGAGGSSTGASRVKLVQ